jgi:RimJ/RimL family protein N-acetyltransferase
VSVLQTERLNLRRLAVDDAPFYFALVNEPSWLKYIGDKGVRSVEDARNAILTGPVAMHDRLGFSLLLVELKDGGVPIGICGLIKRDTLDDVDIGFAFLPAFWGRGYARESAAAVMAYGRDVIGLKRLLAITSPDNDASIRLLEKIGLTYQRTLKLTAGGADTKLFAHDF